MYRTSNKELGCTARLIPKARTTVRTVQPGTSAVLCQQGSPNLQSGDHRPSHNEWLVTQLKTSRRCLYTQPWRCSRQGRVIHQRKAPVLLLHHCRHPSGRAESQAQLSSSALSTPHLPHWIMSEVWDECPSSHKSDCSLNELALLRALAKCAARPSHEAAPPGQAQSACAHDMLCCTMSRCAAQAQENLLALPLSQPAPDTS